MADEKVQITWVNQESFLGAVRQAREAVKDLSPAMSLIAKDFFESEKSVFAQAPGPYADLKKEYKREKMRRWGFTYPVLKASGALMRSMTNPSDQNAISQVNETSFLVGTRVKYGAFIQSGTKKMKARPFLFIGPESRYATSSAQLGRVQRWDAILKSYVLSKLQKQVAA